MYYFGTSFTWDPSKAESNARKHNVTFEEAATVFDDLHAYYERDRSTAELRVAVTGYSSLSRMLFVVFIELEDDVVRVVSARKATPHERQKYRKSQSKA